MDLNLLVESLKSYVEEENFKGYDPYDALCSPILKTFSFNKLLRMAFIQILKKFPLNLRPILGIRKDHNPKALGLFLWGYARLYGKKRKAEYIEKIDYLLELLDELKSRGFSGNCWGYNFDWQSRAFYLPKFTPTVVNTAIIGHALIDAYQYSKKEKALDMAISIKDFILNDLNRREENSAMCLSYSPLDSSFVHNANLLGSSFIIRICKYVGDSSLKDFALASLDYTLKYQREDGAWYYAESDFQKWIDSFHTGFNLQSILYFLEEGYIKYKNEFEKGVNFYMKNFFLADGSSKYYHNKLYPIDIHSAAQAVIFFSQMGNDYKYLAKKILIWMIDNMQDGRGYFYYQKRRFYTNKIPYMRWSQAWSFYAITTYLYYHD